MEKEYYQKHKVEIILRVKKWYKKNKEYRKNYMKKYNRDNKEKLKKTRYNYYITNLDNIKKIQQRYYIKNKLKIEEYKRKWYEENPNYKIEYCKNYYKKNKQRCIELSKKSYNYKLKNNLNFKIACLLRHRLNESLKWYTESGKLYSSKYYGIDWSKVVLKLINELPKDFKREDYHIDHIIPLSKFNLSNPNEVKKAFSPENHQWLLAYDNMSKGNKLDWSKN